MHMSDALISPQVGGAFWAASAGLIAYSARRIRKEADDRGTPLMAVMGAFVFAAQMVNFSIPGTGSSGHLGGGLLLALLLGPYRAFITLSSVLIIQALFFADGGIMALGCNIFNLAFFPAFVIFPLIWKPLTGISPSRPRMTAVTIFAGIVGMTMGAFMVVMQTVASGVTDLPFGPFVAFMLPIHVAIGLVEGLVTAAVFVFVSTIRPVAPTVDSRTLPKWVPAVFIATALIVGGVVSWFASANPDGLEWSILRVTGSPEVEGGKNLLGQLMASVQHRLSFLPDYDFAHASSESPIPVGTSVAGVVGSLLTLTIVAGMGAIVRIRRRVRTTP